jgi:hypothetical protein
MIQTFRKRPVEVQVMRWDGGGDPAAIASSAAEIIQWIMDAGGLAHYRCIDPMDCPASGHVIAIHTLEGVMNASVGDVIIRGVSGEFYPCKPDIFDLTYEPDLMKFYIAVPGGPRGPEFNYSTFEGAAQKLRDAGYEVESPTANAGKGENWRDYMRLGITQALTCDGVALLPGWDASKGASLEATVMWGLDLPVYPLDRWLDPGAAERITRRAEALD